MAERRLRELAPPPASAADGLATEAPVAAGSHPLRLLTWIGLGLVAVHCVGSWWLISSLWGVHAYAFLPPWAILLGLASLGLAWLAVRRGDARAARWMDAVTRAPRSRILRPALLFAGALAMLWIFRARHLLLGDGLVLSRSILQPQSLHPLEPLGMLLQQAWCSGLAPRLRGTAWAEPDLGWQTLALSSAVAGALFVVLADGVVRQIHRAAGTAETESRGLGLALLVVLAQGYSQVFFGYVENYALLVLAIAYYVWCALSYLNGRGSLLPVILSCLVAVCVHLSAAVLLPSLAFVIGVGFRLRRWRSFWGEILAGGLIAAVTLALLSQLGLGYDLVRTLLATIGRVATPESDTPGYVLSGAHVLDVLNEQLLVGPLGLMWTGVGLAGLRGSSGRTAVRRFLLALAAPWLLVALLAGDSNLGYARNWDLLAPTGFVFIVTGLFLLLEQTPTPERRHAALALGLAISLFHTAPWIAVNASLDRGIARFASLPLGGGRTESTLGCWYFRQGDFPEAERWLDRSISANPANPRAHYWAGRVYTATGRIEAAEAAFARARELRPDVATFRLAWINSLVRLGQLEPALRESDELLRSDGSNPRRWALFGAVLLELGRSRVAREAFERAALLAPEDPRPTRLAHLSGATTLVPREDLDALTGL